MKPLTEQEIRKIVQDEITRDNSNMGNISTGVYTVTGHNHDGNNSDKINYSNIEPGNSNTAQFTVTGGTATENTATFSLLISQNGINVAGATNNPKQLTFRGVAYTPESGTITSKASLFGTAFFGTSYQKINAFDISKQNLTKSIATTITQTNNSITFVRTSVTGGYSWIPYVNSDNANIATILDENGNQVGCIQVIAYTNTDITIQAPLNSGWIISGYLTVI